MQLFEEHPKLSRYVVFSFWCAWLCVWTHAETHERFTRVLTSSGWIHFAAQMMQRSRGIFHYPPRSTPLWRCTSSSQQCEPTAGPWARGGKNYWTLDVEGLNDNAPVGTQYGTKRLEGCSTLTLHRWSSAGHAADGRWGVREAGRLSKGWRRDMSQLAITTSVITWNMLHVNAKPLSKTDRSHTACLYCLDCHTEYFENVFALFVLWMAHMVRSLWFLSTKNLDMSQEGNSRTESWNHPPESLGMIRSRFGSEAIFESFRYIRVASRREPPARPTWLGGTCTELGPVGSNFCPWAQLGANMVQLGHVWTQVGPCTRTPIKAKKRWKSPQKCKFWARRGDLGPDCPGPSK
jgi:hypothetical protein